MSYSDIGHSGVYIISLNLGKNAFLRSGMKIKQHIFRKCKKRLNNKQTQMFLQNQNN